MTIMGRMKEGSKENRWGDRGSIAEGGAKEGVFQCVGGRKRVSVKLWQTEG